MTSLLLHVRLHEPRFHGAPDWPPSPARLFQALVAAAGSELEGEEVRRALEWLERLPPPEIAVPEATLGQELVQFVPNNDLDSQGGDPSRVAAIRVSKSTRARWLEGEPEMLYRWRIGDRSEDAAGVVALADRLYQFGRGVDMAWARAEIVTDERADAELADSGLQVHRPSPGGGELRLACPRPGTLASLRRRHTAMSDRFGRDGKLRVFSQPPKALVSEVGYGSAHLRYVFELRSAAELERFHAVRQRAAHALVVRVRDAALARLEAGLGTSDALRQCVLGARPGEPRLVAASERVRVVPLPSIGHEHADRSIRRVLVEVPVGGPVSAADLRWGFAGLLVDDFTLLEAAHPKMTEHYTRPSRVWVSVTPVALPASRRRIDPDAVAANAKGSPERIDEEMAARRALVDALRHAEIPAPCLGIEVQREPFQPRGDRAEVFAAAPRFPKERLWHVRIRFDRPVRGPLAVGDGRFLGLGVLAPESRRAAYYVWDVADGLVDGAAPLDVAGALRRAVIARCQVEWGRSALPAFVTGHTEGGHPAEGHAHLSFVADLGRRRLWVVVPGGAGVRIDRALTGLLDLRAGPAGRLALKRTDADADTDPLLAPSTVWRSVTPYQVERHERGVDAADAVRRDLVRVLRESELPEPHQVEIARVISKRGEPLAAEVRIVFAAAVAGPLLLGRSRHKGGGVFEGGPR